MQSRRKRTIVILIAALSAATLVCALPGAPPTSQSVQMSRGTGYSDAQGQVAFVDPISSSTIPVKVIAADNEQPLSNIRVEFLSNGSRVLIVAYDEDGQYLPSVYDDALPTGGQGLFSVPVAHAQIPVGLILLALEWKGKYQTVQDLKSLTVSDRPEVDKWNWTYHEECWTHEQLGKGLNLAVESISLFFPVGDAFGDAADQLAKAMMIASGEVISGDTSELFANLPDPVRLRIYHVPIQIPTITVQVVGPCQSGEATPPAEGGFATLLAQPESSGLPATTATPGTQIPLTIAPTATRPISPAEMVAPSAAASPSLLMGPVQNAGDDMTCYYGVGDTGGWVMCYEKIPILEGRIEKAYTIKRANPNVAFDLVINVAEMGSGVIRLTIPNRCGGPVSMDGTPPYGTGLMAFLGWPFDHVVVTLEALDGVARDMKLYVNLSNIHLHSHDDLINTTVSSQMILPATDLSNCF